MERSSLKSGTEPESRHVDFGVYDSRHRRMGSKIITYEEEFVELEPGSVSAWIIAPGHYFVFCPHTTRDGKTYGPLQPRQYSKSAEERDRKIEKYLSNAKKRAGAAVSNGDWAEKQAKKVAPAFSSAFKDFAASIDMGKKREALLDAEDESQARYYRLKEAGVDPSLQGMLLNNVGIFLSKQPHYDEEAALKYIMDDVHYSRETARVLLQEAVRMKLHSTLTGDTTIKDAVSGEDTVYHKAYTYTNNQGREITVPAHTERRVKYTVGPRHHGKGQGHGRRYPGESSIGEARR